MRESPLLPLFIASGSLLAQADFDWPCFLLGVLLTLIVAVIVMPIIAREAARKALEARDQARATHEKKAGR